MTNIQRLVRSLSLKFKKTESNSLQRVKRSRVAKQGAHIGNSGIKLKSYTYTTQVLSRSRLF